MNRFIYIAAAAILCFNSFSQQPFDEVYPKTPKKSRVIGVTGILTALYSAELYHLQFVWYKDKKVVPFKFYDDRNTFLQVDKLGHAFGAYYESTFAYYAFRWAGLSKKQALIFGGPVGLLFQTPIEVLDGIHKGYGFSVWDMIANTFGSALFTAQEAIWGEQIVMMKFSYFPSKYPPYHPGVLGSNFGESFVVDFNAHTYWLSFNMKRISGIEKLPPWLNMAIGYSGEGIIGEYENRTNYLGKPIPYFPRYRQYLLSLDVDFSKINVKSNFLKGLFRVLLIKVPFPTLEYNVQEGVVFRPFYF